RAAEWALGLGAPVAVIPEGKESVRVGRIKDLPPGPFRVVDLTLVDRVVTDEDLARLKELTELVALQLDGTQVTDPGLVHLKGLPKLKALFLHRTAITDKGVEHLKAIKGLEILILPRQITDDGVRH